MTAVPTFDPAWQPWLALLDVALRAAEDPTWGQGAVALDEHRAPDAPLLHGAAIGVDWARLRALLRELGSADVDAIDAGRLVTSAIAADAESVDVVSQFAVMPLLGALARRLGPRVSAAWPAGWCPVCGAWPALVEVRGLERHRRLRCGRCASDWALPVLRCAFCGETDHERLRTLLPEGQEQTRRIDACDACGGYLKSVSTLQAMPLRAVAYTDLATVELDLAAQERGYARPAEMGYAVRCRAEPSVAP